MVNWETFNDGLVITGIGMGLVFLTLIIVMYVIKLLDWAFKPKLATPAAAVAPTVAAPMMDAAPLLNTAPANDRDNVARAAAAGVALALQQTRVRAVAVAAAAAVSRVVYRGPVGSPKPWDEGIDYETHVDGEVVMVIDAQPGSGTWKGQGRVQALQQ